MFKDDVLLQYHRGKTCLKTTSFFSPHREMRGAAMSLSAAASGFVVFLLSVSVVQGQNGWGVTYTSTKICALKGSTVDISCTYRYPSSIYGINTKIEKEIWFTRVSNHDYVDIKTDPEYSGRVQYICGNNDCTLRITDLRESDSAEYKFRFTTNQHDGKYTGSPGVTLSVTDALRVATVSVSPSGEIVEGSSVTLSCTRYDPAATYTWYKRNGNRHLQPPSKEPQLVFRSIQSSDSGEYYCTAENKLGKNTSEYISINVKYAPRVPSVSVSPSGEIVENSTVTLTCSSDANPAANYTWYKEDEDSPKASGQIFTITDFRPEHSGNYYCEAQNRRGRHNSTLHLIVVAGAGGKLAAAGAITVVLLAIISLSVFLWIRKKRASKESSEPEERADNREQLRTGQPEEQDLQYASVHFSNNQADPLYANIRAARPLRHMEQQEVIEYAAVSFNRASTAPRTRGQETGEDSVALYSTVNKTR